MVTCPKEPHTFNRLSDEEITSQHFAMKTTNTNQRRSCVVVVAIVVVVIVVLLVTL